MTDTERTCENCRWWYHRDEKPYGHARTEFTWGGCLKRGIPGHISQTDRQYKYDDTCDRWEAADKHETDLETS